MKTTFTDLHDAFHANETKISNKSNRSMSESYIPNLGSTGGFMPKKPQTPAQHASVKKAAAASVAKRRGEMPLTFKPTKGAF